MGWGDPLKRVAPGLRPVARGEVQAYALGMSAMVIDTLAALTVHRHRVIAAVVFLAGAGLLGLAGWLSPSGAGVGTHTQLGMPTCTVLLYTDKPCPGCGMTTAFTHMMSAQPVAAFRVQPAGAVLCLLVIAATAISGYVMLSGRNVWPRIKPWLGAPTWMALGLLLLGAWLYKWNTV